MLYYIVGIIAVGLLPVLPSLPILLAAGIGVLVAGRLPILRYFLLGCCVAASWGHWQLLHRAPPLPLGNSYQLEGYISGLPERQGNRYRFDLRLTAATSQDLSDIRKVRLSWYRPDQELKAGTRLSVSARLYAPGGLSNPAGFDYPRWLLSRGLDATGYVKSLQVVEENGCCAADRLRGEIADWLNRVIADEAATATLQALILGVKSGLTDLQWQTLRQTGTVHLVVISGLHIGFAALAGGWFGRWLAAALMRRKQDQRLPIVLGALLCAGGYALLSGGALPVQRAMLMLAVFMLAWLGMRHVSHWQRWLLALAVVLSFSPLSFYEAGLWLSFAAVAILLWLGEIRHQKGLWWRTQLSIAIGMLPLLVGWFGGSSLLAPLINLVAIPFTALLLLFSTLMLALSAMTDFTVMLLPVQWLINGFWAVLHWCAALPGNYLEIPTPPLWALLLATLGVVLWLLPAGVHGRLLAPLLWLPMLLGPGYVIEPRAFEAWLFDVGQGLSLYVRSGQRHLLYDTGPAYRSGRSAFDTAILPMLQQHRVGSLDMLVLSHADNDHAGGRQRVVSQLAPPVRLSGSARLVREEGYQRCEPGQQWQWGGTRLTMLAGSLGSRENSRSCVLKISHGDCHLLATGDIGFTQEHRLKSQPVHWLLASHHGSRYGTSGVLLDRLKPEILLVSAGRNNPFGHPHPDVLRRAQERGISVMETSHAGAIRLTVGPDGRCQTEGWRQLQKRYWQIP